MSPLNRWIYAVTLLTAVLLAWFLVRNRQKRLSLSRSERLVVGVSAFTGAMLGAKLPFVGERGWDAFFDGTIWFADGKTILGGIFGGYLAVEIGKWIAGVRVKTGDSFAMPIAVAVAIGRVGCFIAGCCFGCVTTVPWGVSFPTAGDPVGVLRHPTQLYEACFHGLAVIGLAILARKNWFSNNQLKLYLICYLVFRFFSEWLRPESTVLLNLTAYQIASVVLGAILIVLWVRDARPQGDANLPDGVRHHVENERRENG